MPRELLRPRFETTVGNFIYRRKKKDKEKARNNTTTIIFRYVKFSWGQYTGKAPGKERAGNVCLKEGLNGGVAFTVIG